MTSDVLPATEKGRWLEDCVTDAQIGWALDDVAVRVSQTQDIERQLLAERERVIAAEQDWAIDGIEEQLDQLRDHLRELEAEREQLVDERLSVGVSWPEH